MRMRNTVLISVIAFCLAGMAAIAAFSMIRNAPFVGFTDATTMLHELGGYKNWTPVNRERSPMAIPVALLCTAPAIPAAPGDTSIIREAGRVLLPGAPLSPHDTAAIRVYVNEVGRNAMMRQARPRFPVGSMVVKEKFETLESEHPELLTVMLKREEGYDPDGGDWEYLVVDGDVSEIRARGALASCKGCHQGREAHDYIFRTYLPEDAVRALK